MRILAIADIHGVLGVYEWLIDWVSQQNIDLLVIAGDLFAGDWEDGQRKQAGPIISALKRTGVLRFYLTGNDDNVALHYQDERIKSLHGKRLSCRGYHLVGYQYTAPSFVGRLFVKSEEETLQDQGHLHGP